MTGPERHDVQPESGKAVRLAKGQHIKLINTHGTQVIDFWAFNAEDLSEVMSMHHTKSCLKKMIPAEGEAFVTYKRRPILTFGEDHSPGVHDVVLPACDRHRYAWEGVDGYHNSCGDNLIRAFEGLGLEPPAVTPQPLNLWMNCPIHSDRRIDYLPTVTKPGDYAVFRAEMDCIAAISACPYDLSLGINGPGGPTEVHYEVY